MSNIGQSTFYISTRDGCYLTRTFYTSDRRGIKGFSSRPAYGLHLSFSQRPFFFLASVSKKAPFGTSVFCIQSEQLSIESESRKRFDLCTYTTITCPDFQSILLENQSGLAKNQGLPPS